MPDNAAYSIPVAALAPPVGGTRGAGRWLSAARALAEVALGLVFVVAGLQKLLHQDQFVTSIFRFDLVGPGAALLIGAVMPWLEIIVAFMLLTGTAPRAGAVLATVMLGVFTFAIASALARGLEISCGCFGGDQADNVSAWTLARNAGLLAVAAFVLATRQRTASGAGIRLADGRQ